MQTAFTQATVDRDAYRIHEQKSSAHWDVDRDVIRGRDIDVAKRFLPDGLTRVSRFEGLNGIEQRMLSQVQGRTYVNLFGLLERCLGASVHATSDAHRHRENEAGANARLRARPTKQELLFRRVEQMTDRWMPEGYQFALLPADVGEFTLARAAWSTWALRCMLDLATVVHDHESAVPDGRLSTLWKDILRFRAQEGSRHATVDELEWIREDARLSHAFRDRAVDDLIALIHGVDRLLQRQAKMDAQYFRRLCLRRFTPDECSAVYAQFLSAYRWQYILCGARDERFRADLVRKITPAQAERIEAVLARLGEQASAGGG